MQKATNEENITFRDAIEAVYYMKWEGRTRYPDLTSEDWLSNVLEVMCAIEE